MALPVGLYRHVKTGKMYRVIATAINATNDTPKGQKMVVYKSVFDDGPIVMFVRKEEEFCEPILMADGTTRPRFELAMPDTDPNG